MIDFTGLFTQHMARDGGGRVCPLTDTLEMVPV